MREGDPNSAKLRLVLSYDQNEVFRLDGEVQILQNEIENDAGILQQVRIFIDQLRTPFSFLAREVQSA